MASRIIGAGGRPYSGPRHKRLALPPNLFFADRREVLEEPALRAIVNEQYALASHGRRPITFVEAGCSTARQLGLVAVARDFDRRRGTAVNRVGVASGRRDQPGPVGHADPVVVNGQEKSSTP